jgi:hypothetical protein
MKRIIIILFSFLSPFLICAQTETPKKVIISEEKMDDLYITGETIDINAAVFGDLVAAGGTITINDSISQDLVVSGGNITIKGYVADDIRAAGGNLIIDSEVGDDVIVFGGRVIITKNAIIHGDLISFSGNIEMNGEIKGQLKVYAGQLEINGKTDGEAILKGGDIKLDGEIRGKSQLAAKNIEIGENAKFYQDVQYWSEDNKLDFKNSLINVKANYSEALGEESNGFFHKGFGLGSLIFLTICILSAFLIILFLNLIFRKLFSRAAVELNESIPKSLGIGFLYLIGLPFVILLAFIIIIGIPIGFLLLFLYLFSLFFGHLIAALLLTHYLNKRKAVSWNFWSIVFIALLIAISLHILILIPILGFLLSILIVALSYGALISSFLPGKSSIAFNN